MNPLASIAFGPQIAAAAARHHLDPTLLAAVAAQETGGPGADSGRNIVGDGGHGHGLFQIDDRWHAFASSAAAMDPAKNADYAAGLLAGLIKRYGGDVHAALSAYNAGSPGATGTTTDWGGRVLGYADSVLAHAARLNSGPDEAGTASARDTAMPLAGEANDAANGLRSAAACLAGSPSPVPLPAAPHRRHGAPAEEVALREDVDLDDDPFDAGALADPDQARDGGA